jgi:hypothetical protein
MYDEQEAVGSERHHRRSRWISLAAPAETSQAPLAMDFFGCSG